MSDKKVSEELFLTKDDVYKTIDMLEQAVAEIKRISSQRDQLLEALKKVHDDFSGMGEYGAHYYNVKELIAAVEKSK